MIKRGTEEEIQNMSEICWYI